MPELNMFWVFAIMVFGFLIFILSTRPKKRTFETPEEKSVYRQEIARQSAIKDFQQDQKRRENEQRERMKYTFGRSLFFDDFQKKSKRRR